LHRIATETGRQTVAHRIVNYAGTLEYQEQLMFAGIFEFIDEKI